MAETKRKGKVFRRFFFFAFTLSSVLYANMIELWINCYSLATHMVSHTLVKWRNVYTATQYRISE